MSGDGYSSYSSYYHHQPSTRNYPSSDQSWNNWNLQEQQYMQNYARNPATYSSSSSLTHNTHNNSNHNNFRSQGYHSSPTHLSRSYYRNRYNTSLNNQYSGNQQHGSNWQRNQTSYKRNRLDSSESEPLIKTTKKKKKPLSQNMPNKKEWTMEEAKQALLVEKEHNKKSKNALIIKFPDHELNKEVVSQFHSSIENVHFQQPCTPRFCFVTLKESADPEEVINELNKQKFGDGFLTVEYKKDREEDQAISAEDIDPLTLYVGNLAQEITKEDMLTMYPKNRRIDIGFAKKMKFTRYAFVGFRNAIDSIEAFKKTHSTQMYNKSLIVRFRRLHGTVGMPGESKPQNPPKSKDDISDNIALASDQNISENNLNKEASTSGSINIPDTVGSSPQPVIPQSSEDTHSDTTDMLSLERIKQEQTSPNDSGDEWNHISMLGDDYRSSFSPANLEEYVLNHRPKIKEEVKPEIKKENDSTQSNDRRLNVPRIKSEITEPSFRVKDEPYDYNDGLEWNSYYEHEESDDGEDNIGPAITTDFHSVFENMVNHANRINSLKKAGTDN